MRPLIVDSSMTSMGGTFYPNGDAPITKAQLCDALWEVQDKLRSLGVDMG